MAKKAAQVSEPIIPFAPGHERFEKHSEIVEKWAQARNTSLGHLRKPQQIAAARSAVEEWWRSPDSTTFVRSGKKAAATPVLESRLRGAGMSAELAAEATDLEFTKRFKVSAST